MTQVDDAVLQVLPAFIEDLPRGAVRRLEARGLVQRSPKSYPKCPQVVSLTDEGRAYGEEAGDPQ